MIWYFLPFNHFFDDPVAVLTNDSMDISKPCLSQAGPRHICMWPDGKLSGLHDANAREGLVVDLLEACQPTSKPWDGNHEGPEDPIVNSDLV